MSAPMRVKAEEKDQGAATGARSERFWRKKEPTALAEAPKEIKTTEKPATKARAEENRPEVGTSPLRSCSMPMPESMEELASAQAAYADLKGRLAKYGRNPDQLAVLPGVMPIHRAHRFRGKGQTGVVAELLTPTNALTLVSGRIGYDVSGYPLDAPVPPPPPGENGSQTFHKVLYEAARRQNMTLRDLYNLTAAARGHWVVCGTPARIADTLEEWFVDGRGRRVQHPAALFPRRVCRFCRSGGPRIAAPRPLPPRLSGDDACAITSASPGCRHRPEATMPSARRDKTKIDAA